MQSNAVEMVPIDGHRTVVHAQGSTPDPVVATQVMILKWCWLVVKPEHTEYERGPKYWSPATVAGGGS